MTIAKNLMEKPSFFIMDSERSYEVPTTSQLFLIYMLLTMKRKPF